MTSLSEADRKIHERFVLLRLLQVSLNHHVQSLLIRLIRQSPNDTALREACDGAITMYVEYVEQARAYIDEYGAEELARVFGSRRVEDFTRRSKALSACLPALREHSNSIAIPT